MGDPQRRRAPLWSAEDHGPLPVMLLVMTLVTGLVDSVSILELGRVFVANMTGNVVFVGFALAGAAGFSLGASLCALAGFVVGAATGGTLIARAGADRASMMRAGAAVELALTGAALGVVSAAGHPLGSAVREVAAALLALGMGIQNALARRLAVPDLTTTVLTMTLTGIAADTAGTRRASGRPVTARRVLAVATMFVGAVVGGILDLRGHADATLAIAVALLVWVLLIAARSALRPGAWRTVQ